MRGRRPAGPAYVEHLEGADEDKKRLKVIMQTMMGELRLLEACRILNVCPQRFHQLRQEAMAGALAGLAPRPKGRPRHLATPEQQRIVDLERQLAAAKVELRAAQAREEIALVLPRVVQEPPATEKKTRRRQ
jgi:transposase-like protein